MRVSDFKNILCKAWSSGTSIARLRGTIQNWKSMTKLAGGGTPGVAYQMTGSILTWSIPMVPAKGSFVVSRRAKKNLPKKNLLFCVQKNEIYFTLLK